MAAAGAAIRGTIQASATTSVTSVETATPQMPHVQASTKDSARFASVVTIETMAIERWRPTAIRNCVRT